MAVAALALLVGLLPAVATRSSPQRSIARQSLHFETFSPNLPVSTLWAGTRVVSKSP